MTIILAIFGGLAVFLYGLKIMSQGLESVAGDHMRNILRKATSNRFAGVLTGLTVTSVVQSSSATTVMMVSFVNAGLLTLTQSAGIIMGANIGTTITGWLVSLLGFKVKISSFALPAIGAGFFVQFLRKEKLTRWGEVLIGFGLLFFGLSLLKDALPDIKSSPELASLLHTYKASGYLSTLMVIAVGAVMTVIVQSSSAVMAVTLAAAANGLINFETGCALVLGENIGTTATALLASIGSHRKALQAASVHSLFNLIGVSWVWLAFPWLTGFIDRIVPGNAGLAGEIPQHLAMFHTLFNVTNTVLMLPFAGLLVKAATRIFPDRDPSLDNGLLPEAWVDMPHLAIEQAQKRLLALLQDVKVSFSEAVEQLAIDTTSGAQRHIDDGLKDRIQRTAAEAARLNPFLVAVSREVLTSEAAAEIARLHQAAHELKRAQIQVKNLVQVGEREDVQFSTAACDEIKTMAEQVTDVLARLEASLGCDRSSPEAQQANRSLDAVLNVYTNTQRAHQARLRQGTCSLASSAAFMDALTAIEQVGTSSMRMAELFESQAAAA